MRDFIVEVEDLPDGHLAVVLTITEDNDDARRYLWPVRNEEAAGLRQRLESAVLAAGSEGPENVFRALGRWPSILERRTSEPRAR